MMFQDLALSLVDRAKKLSLHLRSLCLPQPTEYSWSDAIRTEFLMKKIRLPVKSYQQISPRYKRGDCLYIVNLSSCVRSKFRDKGETKNGIFWVITGKKQGGKNQYTSWVGIRTMLLSSPWSLNCHLVTLY